jgi:exopolysaccharide biosynthesis polyprenyl glycosylphosphotransferase
VTRRKEFLLLVVGDFFALNAAWLAFYWLRVDSGWFLFHRGANDLTPALLPESALLLYLFWMVLFIFFGLYRPWYVRAPFDEIITILKTLAFGTILLSIFIWWDPTNTFSPSANDPRILGLTYWCVIAILCIGIRSLIRYGQRRLLESGVGTRLSIVVGDLEKARDLAARVAHYPRLGYEVIGFVHPSSNGSVVRLNSFMIEQRNGKKGDTPRVREIPNLGTTEDLEAVIDKYNIKEVLIALGSNEHEALIDVIARASKSNAGLKIVPDLYDIVSGQARAREIYGFPLIDVNPVLLRPWEEAAKRTLDIAVSLLMIVLGSPLVLATAVAVKLTSKGPLIYSQERVGRDGKRFRIYKFRSMFVNSEKAGPQWASKNDPRVTPLGRFLRKSHLDEVPQLWNVLKGDMSLVGPRPERDFFVQQLVEEIPYYNRRHRVRPGVTGLYQAMVDKYDENIDDVRQRVKYDLMYIESMSFRLDVKILFRTGYMMFRGKGQA